MDVDWGRASGYAVREMDWQKSRLAREARRGIVIVTVTVMEEWPRGGGIDDRGRTHQTRRADSCEQAFWGEGWRMLSAQVVMTDAGAFCDVSTRPVNFEAGWLLCLLTRAGVECAQQCIGESVLEPHLISLISAGTRDRDRDQGPGAQHSFVCTPRCACPYEHCMMDDVCVCVCA